MKQSVLDVEVSCYKSYMDTKPININLHTFLKSRKHKDEIDLIRSLTDKAERDKKKAMLPAITPSGTFTVRNQEGLIKHSGLIQFDIDYKGNEHIDNFEMIGSEVSKLPYVAYCGYSASGYGFWGLVPIAFPDKHKLHLRALRETLQHYGIKMDSAPSNVASLRGYSYDDQAFINPNASVFNYVSKPQEIYVKRSGNYETTLEQKFQRAIKRTQETEFFADGSKHSFLVRLAGWCNCAGMSYEDVVNLVEMNFRGMTTYDVDLEKPIESVYHLYKNQFSAHPK